MVVKELCLRARSGLDSQVRPHVIDVSSAGFGPERRKMNGD